MKENLEILIKPHPNCPIYNEYSSQNIIITNQPIEELISICDLAYTSSSTSAALEFHFCNIPLITYLNPMDLNMSPLRNTNNIIFITDSLQLLEAINNFIRNKINLKIFNYDFFNLNNDLKRWDNLIYKYTLKKIVC